MEENRKRENIKFRDRKKRKINRRRVFLKSLCAVLSVILAVLVIGTAYMESLLAKINKTNPDSLGGTLSQEEIDNLLNQTDENDVTFTGTEMNSDEVEWDDIFNVIGHGDDVINILLIGQDRRKGEGRSRSDAMILCTLNKHTKTLTMTSFMRDMYVQIPGYRDNRINVCYPLGGMKLLDDCIKKNFGVVIDGNVEVDFTGFKKVINKMGGIDIELTSAEAEYINKRGSGWKLKEGMNHLTGAQALVYSRIRKVGNGDFGRTNRQRVVLSTLVDKAKGMSLTELNRLLNEVLPLLTTDMKSSDMLNSAVQVFKMLPELTIKTERIPADGAYTMTRVNGMSVLLPKLEKNHKILSEIMRTDVDPVEE